MIAIIILLIKITITIYPNSPKPLSQTIPHLLHCILSNVSNLI